MATLRINCSGCGTTLVVDEAHLGKTGRCKQCGARFPIKRPKRSSDGFREGAPASRDLLSSQVPRTKDRQEAAMNALRGQLSDWDVQYGLDAANEAETLGIVSANDAASVKLTPREWPAGMSLEMRGTLACHGCRTEFPFDVTLILVSMGSQELVCPSCGNRITLGQSIQNVDGKKVLFLYATRLTSKIGHQDGLPALKVTDINCEA